MKRPRHAQGDTFIREKTGSATMINLDGQWEHDFVDDNTPAGDRPSQDLTQKKNDKNE